jgi:la-related protein 1
MDPEGYLPITLIASFHRVQALSSDVALVLSAVKESEKLEVHKDFLIRTKNEPLKWPMPNVGTDGTAVVATAVPIAVRTAEHDHQAPPQATFIPVILQAAPPPVSEVLHHIPPPPIIRNSRKNASDNKQQFAAAIPIAVAPIAVAHPPPILPNSSSAVVVDHLNPDVSAFVPKSSPKNEVANAVEPSAAKEHITSGATSSTIPATTASTIIAKNMTDDANIWKEVKRRSKSSQKEILPSSGSDLDCNSVTVNSNASTAVNSNSVITSNANAINSSSIETRNNNTNINNNSSSSTKKQGSVEKEELDFRFDEEMQFEEELPHGGGRINNFSEFSDDEESDYELSDRDINKLLIVTQVKNRPPKHEGKLN